MLVIYRKSDGTVVSNSGTNSFYPGGPPFDNEVQNAIGLHGGVAADYGEFRLHDVDDAETVQAILGAESYELQFEDTEPVGVTNIVPRPVVEPEPEPDTSGYIEALIGHFGIDRAEDLMRQYPTYIRAIDGANWEIAKNRELKMLSDEAVTQEEFDTVQGYWLHFNLPLPEQP